MSYKTPKLLKLGPMWVLIHTKLHERLLQGLVASVLYLCVYLSIFYDIAQELVNHCPQDKQSWDCASELARKFVAVFALVVYIPSLAVCLYHIGRLDAVMDTIESIWAVEDIHKAVRSFNRVMDEVAEHVKLLGMLTQRLLPRKEVVVRFCSNAMKNAQTMGPESSTVLLENMQELARVLEQVQQDLGDAAQWVLMTPEKHKSTIAAARLLMDELASREFRLADTGAMDLPDMPGGSYCVPERLPSVPRNLSEGVGDLEMPSSTFTGPSPS